jgi:hypothetical protein
MTCGLDAPHATALKYPSTTKTHIERHMGQD